MKKQIKQVSDATRSAIREYLSKTEQFKKSYFWSGFGNASARAHYERQNSMEFEGDGIYLRFNISCSRKNLYIDRLVQIDGRTTNATALKKFVA